jgi:hypothetical protein
LAVSWKPNWFRKKIIIKIQFVSNVLVLLVITLPNHRGKNCLAKLWKCSKVNTPLAKYNIARRLDSKFQRTDPMISFLFTESSSPMPTKHLPILKEIVKFWKVNLPKTPTRAFWPFFCSGWISLSREYWRGKYHCTVDLPFDWFGLVCFANKNKNCQ